MRTGTLTSTYFVLATFVAAHPAAASAVHKRDTSDPSWDTQACYWMSTDDIAGIPFGVAWAVLLPQWNGADPSTAQSEFYSAVASNSACDSVLTPGWAAVGAQSSTTALWFGTSDFCTAWQVSFRHMTASCCISLTSQDDAGDQGHHWGCRGDGMRAVGFQQ